MLEVDVNGCLKGSRLGVRWGWAVAVAVTCHLALVALVFAQVPMQFTYQGRLTDSNGVPVVGGMVTGVFQIISGGIGLSGGIVVHAETNVITPDANGVFSQIIGAKPGLPLDLADFTTGTTSRWISVSLGTQEFLPRQQILAVPYAVTAAGVVPVGGVVMWWGAVNAIPSGFELCDGTPFGPGALLSGNKPNLQARFPRGAPVGATNVQAAAVVGGADSVNLTHQHDMTHTHAMPIHSHAAGGLRAAIHFDGGSHESFYLDESSTDFASPADSQIYIPGSEALVESSSGFPAEAGNESTVVFGSTADSAAVNVGTLSPSLTVQALGTTSILPSYTEMFYIIRVR